MPLTFSNTARSSSTYWLGKKCSSFPPSLFAAMNELPPECYFCKYNYYFPSLSLRNPSLSSVSVLPSPTEHSTISKLWINFSDLCKIGRSPDFQALSLSNARSGRPSCLRSILTMKDANLNMRARLKDSFSCSWNERNPSQQAPKRWGWCRSNSFSCWAGSCSRLTS